MKISNVVVSMMATFIESTAMKYAATALAVHDRNIFRKKIALSFGKIN